MDTKGFIDHILISILGSLLGISAGWGMGYVLMLFWRKSNLEVQKFSPFLFFIPWRTFICGLLLANYFPILVILQFGLGNTTGILSVAHIVFWLTLITVFQSAQAKIMEPTLHFLSGVRTWTVFSVLLTAHFGIWGGGGLGFAAKEQIFIMKYDSAWAYLWYMVGIALVLDMTFAIGQVVFYYYTTRRNAG